MSAMARPSLKGRRVLVVEDRFLIAQDIASEVAALGGEVVGPVATVADALRQVSHGAPDLALLDVDLDGETVFAVADALCARRAPLIFVTGYDEWVLPPQWRSFPRLGKPVRPVELRRQIAKALTTLDKPR